MEIKLDCMVMFFRVFLSDPVFLVYFLLNLICALYNFTGYLELQRQAVKCMDPDTLSDLNNLLVESYILLGLWVISQHAYKQAVAVNRWMP